jgi:hypothetical protein
MNAGNQYVAQIVPQANSDVCDPPDNMYTKAQLMTTFANGVASDTLSPEPSTGRISAAQLQQHVQSLLSSGVLPQRPMVKVSDGYETDMNKLVPQDSDLFGKLRDEYCYYEQRYRYALQRFLTYATNRMNTTVQQELPPMYDSAGNRQQISSSDAAQDMLQVTKILNLRLNSVLEVMNYLAQSRVDIVNSNKSQIDSSNTNINNKLQKLNQSYKMLNQDNVIVNTQKASVLYTEEKNNYTTNQISVWAALNVIALATIFYVYRT